MILVDTNVPLRLAQPGHPHRQPALDAIKLLTLREKEYFVIAPQSLYELYVVCTRPAGANGLGMAPQRAHAEITSARTLFHVLPETTQVYPVWESLVARYAIQGKQAHDARLVAIMLAHRVRRLLTFNDADFKQFTEIGALNPFEVLGIPRI